MELPLRITSTMTMSDGIEGHLKKRVYSLLQ